jgi:hypothetical protein
VATSNWIGPLAHRLAGGGWTPVAGPDVPQFTDFEDVDCPTPDVCALVGEGGSVDGVPHVLLAILSDGEWSVSRHPGGSAVDVDCWSADGCVAVTTGASAGLDVWDGTRWLPARNPAGIAAPIAVSCGAPARCEVVGSFIDGADRAPVTGVVLDV